MKVPWRTVHSWNCKACGECCIEYKPKLTFYEYLTLPRQFVEERNGRYYIKKIGKRCPFQIGRLCGIQKKKPLSCILFPFSIYTKGEDEAYFEYRGEEYYVYVDTFCKNVRLGKPTPSFIETVKEAIKIFRGENRNFTHLTSKKVQAQIYF